MRTIVYWFRNDLRLEDNPAFLRACNEVDYLLPIYIHQTYSDQDTSWGFPRVGEHRKVFLDHSLQELRSQLQDLGSDLYEVAGDVLDVFEKLNAQIDVDVIYCEEIEAPEELVEIALLRDAGFQVDSTW